ncbi:MAG: PCI domain-containing protein 2 [Marteilia pararefringens]
MAQHFFADISRSYKQADVSYLKSLVDLKHNFPSTNFTKIAFDYSKTENSYIQDFSVAVLDFWQFFNGNICKQSFERYCALLKSFTELIQNDKETSWQVPILKVIIKNTMMISLELSKDLTKKESNYVLESAADAILSSFRLCASELRVTFERSKKQALLFSASCLFKIYFRMSNLHLCKSIMLAIDTSNVDFSLFPINEQVTYKYYCGWKYLYDFDVPSATQCLEYAYKLCSKRYFSNRRLILLLLIPLKMICGQRISTAKIQEYELYPFATLIDAIEEECICETWHLLANVATENCVSSKSIEIYPWYL